MPDVLDIASLPGMPDLLFGPVPADTAPVALVADALNALSFLGPPAWGIYDGSGAPVVIADTVMDLGYSKAYTVSDFPIESGTYESFDKVEQPYEARVRLAAGGSLAVREAFLESVEAILDDLNLYTVVTPEKIYFNCNILREEYRRTVGEGGASLLIIEVSVQEVRLPTGGSPNYNPSDPFSANMVDGGTVTPIAATPSEMAAAGLTPVTTPSPLGGGIGGLPVSNPSAGGIGSA